MLGSPWEGVQAEQVMHIDTSLVTCLLLIGELMEGRQGRPSSCRPGTAAIHGGGLHRGSGAWREVDGSGIFWRSSWWEPGVRGGPEVTQLFLVEHWVEG